MYFAFYHRKVLDIYFGRLKFLEIVFKILAVESVSSNRSAIDGSSIVGVVDIQ